MHDYTESFRYIAKEFADNRLPVDDANWDIYCPKNHETSITETLEYFEDSSDTMSEELCELLDTPVGASYADGVKKICQPSVNKNGG